MWVLPLFSLPNRDDNRPSSFSDRRRRAAIEAPNVVQPIGCQIIQPGWLQSRIGSYLPMTCRQFLHLVGLSYSSTWDKLAEVNFPSHIVCHTADSSGHGLNRRSEGMSHFHWSSYSPTQSSARVINFNRLRSRYTGVLYILSRMG
jgi:hypothetical protein